jgi:hypothetical protein
MSTPVTAPKHLTPSSLPYTKEDVLDAQEIVEDILVSVPPPLRVSLLFVRLYA